MTAAPRTLWLVQEKTPAQIADSERRMMAKWLRAQAEKKRPVTIDASSAMEIAEMIDPSTPVQVKTNA